MKKHKMCPATLLIQQEEVEHVLAVVVTAPVFYVSALQTAGAMDMLQMYLHSKHDQRDAFLV